MKTYTVLVSGYVHGYVTSELFTIESDSEENACYTAEEKSMLDGACGRVVGIKE